MEFLDLKRSRNWHVVELGTNAYAFSPLLSESVGWRTPGVSPPKQREEEEERPMGISGWSEKRMCKFLRLPSQMTANLVTWNVWGQKSQIGLSGLESRSGQRCVPCWGSGEHSAFWPFLLYVLGSWSVLRLGPYGIMWHTHRFWGLHVGIFGVPLIGWKSEKSSWVRPEKCTLVW